MQKMAFMQNFTGCRLEGCSLGGIGRKTKEFLIIFFLVSLTFYLFLFKIGEPSLWEADEPIYGEVAKEILKLGDWITLHFNYREWFDKPPLYMWITSLFYRLFGWNEFTTRFTSSLFGIGEVVVVYFFGKILFSRRTGFFSAIVLATSIQFLAQSRLALLDVPLTFFITLSFFFFYLAFNNPGKRTFLLLFPVPLALATLTKGPVGFVIPLLTIFFFVLAGKNLHKLRLRKTDLFLAFLIFFAIAFPWYGAQIYLHGKEFMDKFFILRNVKRFTTNFEGHAGPFYYYVPFLFLGFFPWSSFLPFSLFHLFKKEKKDKVFLIFSWILVIFLFFSSARSKLPGYILPLYPACALSVGRLWDCFFDGINKIKKKGILLSFSLFFFLIVAFSAFIFIFGRNFFPYEYNIFKKGIFLTVLFFFLTGIFSLFFIFKKATFISFFSLAGGVFLMVGVLTLQILPLAENTKPTKFLAIQVRNSLNPGDKIGNYPASSDNFMSFNASFVFYTDRKVEGIEDSGELKSFLSSPKRVFCLMRKKEYEKIKKELEGISSYVFARKNGEIIISNR